MSSSLAHLKRVAQRFLVSVSLLTLLVSAFAVCPLASICFVQAQTRSTVSQRILRPDIARAIRTRAAQADGELTNKAHVQARRRTASAKRNRRNELSHRRSQVERDEPGRARRIPSARDIAPRATGRNQSSEKSTEHNIRPESAALPPIRSGTPLRRVLHTAQLSLESSAGSVEQFVDQNRDLTADEQTTFNRQGGAFAVAVGNSGARYEVFTANDDQGTPNTSDDKAVGVLVVALDTNGDYVQDSSTTYDLRRDWNLPSAAAVVAGIGRDNREFLIVSSSGYYNRSDPTDPQNESSAGVVLLVRDPVTNSFDSRRSQLLVSVGSDELSNANALALLPTNDLLIADFDAGELRIIRDTNGDRVPDTLDTEPYHRYEYADDAPLEVGVNSRGVVFSYSVGDDALLLALYDTNGDGYANTEEIAAEGLSISDNLLLHGLVVNREGEVFVVEDAAGANDPPRIIVFPDPALNGFLRDGAVFVDDVPSDALTGLAFGDDDELQPVDRLTLVNSASLRSPATSDGLASITGSNLTNGARGASEADAQRHDVRVTVEGQLVPVFSFNDNNINIHVPARARTEETSDIRSVVVTVRGVVRAADDVKIERSNPGLFTIDEQGSGAAVALLVSEMRYTAGPFPPTTNNEASVIALFGTGWRNALPLQVQIGNQPVTIEYAGPGTFPGLDQLNVRLPTGARGNLPVTVTTADGKTSRADVHIEVR